MYDAPRYVADRHNDVEPALFKTRAKIAQLSMHPPRVFIGNTADIQEAHSKWIPVMERHATIRDAESDDEADQDCPVLDSFYAADGNEGVLKMTNLTTSEFWDQYNCLHSQFLRSGTSVMGKRAPLSR